MKNLISIVVLLLGIAVAPHSWAVAIWSSDANNGTDVGVVDTIIAEDSTLINSSPTTEEAFVESALDAYLGTTGTDVTFSTSTENVQWYNTDTTDVIAFELVTGPGFYVIKNAQLWVLMENQNDLNWGVLDLGLVSGDINLGDDFQISHVTEFNGGHVEVTEPSSLALLGLGLLGLGVATRRRKS